MLRHVDQRCFFLTGWLTFSTCLLHRYHFANKNLATIENPEEMNQLINTVLFAGYNPEVWIGLYFNLYQSLTYDIRADYWDWQNQTKNDLFLIYYLCEIVSSDHSSRSINCSVEHPFICSNGEYMSNHTLISECNAFTLVS
uniref:C-type lectin domain-containing protein n=1 Tax=Monopterus albus TaxID=43700 RepID=A0A3Q3KFB4_MONAL